MLNCRNLVAIDTEFYCILIKEAKIRKKAEAMSTQTRFRTSVVRTQRQQQNREQCMLNRAATEIGLPTETTR